jgi:hypothetical protein
MSADIIRPKAFERPPKPVKQPKPKKQRRERKPAAEPEFYKPPRKRHWLLATFDVNATREPNFEAFASVILGMLVKHGILQFDKPGGNLGQWRCCEFVFYSNRMISQMVNCHFIFRKSGVEQLSPPDLASAYVTRAFRIEG